MMHFRFESALFYINQSVINVGIIYAHSMERQYCSAYLIGNGVMSKGLIRKLIVGLMLGALSAASLSANESDEELRVPVNSLEINITSHVEGGDFLENKKVSSTPELGTLALLALGLICLGAARRKAADSLIILRLWLREAAHLSGLFYVDSQKSKRG